VRGSAALNVRLGDNDFLLDHVGDGFTGLIFCQSAPGPEVRRLIEHLQRRDSRFKPLFVSVGPAGDGASSFAGGDNRIATVYGARPGTFYLLRPDLHVAGRWSSIDASEITASLDACLGRVAS
jgi:3-(3-hydroxy-phenyl)propionate hydroxylase